jgi:hypothetical protein
MDYPIDPFTVAKKDAEKYAFENTYYKLSPFMRWGMYCQSTSAQR